MAYGTLALDTLQSSTTGVPTQFQDGSGTQIGTLCRAWVNFNGVTTATIRASFNVSSVVRNGAGDYTINFTNALADANYDFALSTSGSDSNRRITCSESTVPTPSAIRVVVGYNTSTLVDATFNSVAIFR